MTPGLTLFPLCDTRSTVTHSTVAHGTATHSTVVQGSVTQRPAMQQQATVLAQRDTRKHCRPRSAAHVALMVEDPLPAELVHLSGLQQFEAFSCRQR